MMVTKFSPFALRHSNSDCFLFTMIYNNDFSLLLKQSEVKKKKKEIQPDMFVLHYKEETETVGTSLLSLTLSSPV